MKPVHARLTAIITQKTLHVLPKPFANLKKPLKKSHKNQILVDLGHNFLQIPLLKTHWLLSKSGFLSEVLRKPISQKPI